MRLQAVLAISRNALNQITRFSDHFKIQKIYRRSGTNGYKGLLEEISPGVLCRSTTERRKIVIVFIKR